MAISSGRGSAETAQQQTSGAGRRLWVAIGCLFAAFTAGGLMLLMMGIDPLLYYGYVIERGLLSSAGLQQTLTRAAPLMLMAASLILAFRSGIWNLGIDGQFLLGAVAAAASAPFLAPVLPWWATVAVASVLAVLAAVAWSIVPAVLRAYRGVNEVVSTLMMTFLGTALANLLVKYPFKDPATTVPQTRTLAVEDRLPRLFGTTVSGGLVLGLAGIVLVHFVMTRTAFGLKLRILGGNPRAAAHAGLRVPALTIAAFAISAGLAGLAGYVEVAGVQGNVRADWNPAYGFTVIPAIFLARFNGFASIAFVFLLAAISVGAESAARRLGVPSTFTLILVATLLVVLTVAEHAQRSRADRQGDGQ